MEKLPFVTWLLAKRAFAQKSAQDAASRCKRIEKILGMPLERAVSSQARYDEALERVWRFSRRNDLLYAFRLYATFKSPRLDIRKHRFYRDLVKGAKAK